jgi:hypothetical protein
VYKGITPARFIDVVGRGSQGMAVWNMISPHSTLSLEGVTSWLMIFAGILNHSLINTQKHTTFLLIFANINLPSQKDPTDSETKQLQT